MLRDYHVLHVIKGLSPVAVGLLLLTCENREEEAEAASGATGEPRGQVVCREAL